MKTIESIYKFIDKVSPFNTAMDFDNCGLIVGDENQYVDRVLLSLDITHDVVEEAHRLGAQLIISHHPVIFKPLRRLSPRDIPYILAKYGMSAICAHTNLDMAELGVNRCLADALEIYNTRELSIYSSETYNKISVFCPEKYADNIISAMSEAGAGKYENYSKCSFSSKGVGRFLPEYGSSPFIGEVGIEESTEEIKIEMICPQYSTDKVIDAMRRNHPYEQPAFDIYKNYGIKNNIPLGLVGELKESMKEKDFALYVKNKLNCEGVRYTILQKELKTVAVCSGAGGDMVHDAYNKGADVLVTGEIKHNMILEANNIGISIVDAGHFKTEDVVILPLMNLLKDNFSEIKFFKTTVFTDNIKYI